MKSPDQKTVALARMVSDYCAVYLDPEFGALCEKVIKKLTRNRSRPLETGTLEIWAAGVIHAAGTVNFLFDKTAELFVPPDSLAAYFGCTRVSMENRSRQIRALLKMRPLDAEYSVSANRESRKAKGAMFDRSMSDIVALMKGRGIRPEVRAQIEQLRAEQAAGGVPLKPSSTEAEYAEIEAKLKAIGPTKAIERSLRELIEQHPEFASAYESLAYVLEYQGMDAEAAMVKTKRPVEQ